MKKIYGGIVIFFLCLAYYMFVPEIVCSVSWVDSEHRPIDGEFYECKGNPIRTRSIGFMKFAKFGDDIYRVTEIYGGRLPSRGLRPRKPKNYLLIKLDGPVDWDHLQSYMQDGYLSDGKVILDSDGRRVLALDPPLDIANMKSVPSAAGLGRTEDYSTDGRWVILHGEVVEGADAPTFKQVHALELDGSQVETHVGMMFARDKNFVYHGVDRLSSADPDSFGIVSYFRCPNATSGIQFFSDRVELGSAWVAVDRTQAWEVDFNGITLLDVTNEQLKTLQDNLDKAIAASKQPIRPKLDPNLCNS